MREKENTPIIDFLSEYAGSDPSRLHMPGHKGTAPFGVPEALRDAYMYDITEIAGADDLYDPKGIILKSEEIAGSIFGAPTFYSTEGSSQCVKAMLKLAADYAKESDRRSKGVDRVPTDEDTRSAYGKAPYIICAGTAHKAFMAGTELLGIEVVRVAAEQPVEAVIKAVDDEISAKGHLPIGIFVTYPDYYGNVIDLAALKNELSKRGILLLVDGAHAAYFKFLDHSKYPDYIHPVDAGADICCCSAHKTLPALTGAAYLHISVDITKEKILKAMSLFGSSSPSYLILASLDAVNGSILLNSNCDAGTGNVNAHSTCDDKGNAINETGFAALVNITADKADALKERLSSRGICVLKSDPLRLVVRAGAGQNLNMPEADMCVANTASVSHLAANMRRAGCEPECINGDDIIMMLSPYNTDRDFERIYEALTACHSGDPAVSGRDDNRGYDIGKNFT